MRLAPLADAPFPVHAQCVRAGDFELCFTYIREERKGSLVSAQGACVFLFHSGATWLEDLSWSSAKHLALPILNVSALCFSLRTHKQTLMLNLLNYKFINFS